MLVSEIEKAIGSIAAVDNRAGRDIDIRYLLTDSRQLGAHRRIGDAY